MSSTSSPSIVPREPRKVAAGIARRDFLRTCAVAGVALASGFLRYPIEAAAAAGPSGKMVVGLEIGTSKVCAVVTERLLDGTIQLLGIGRAPSRGIGRCGILDFEAASACVREALVDAEIKCDVMIRSVILAVAGTKIASYHARPPWEEICYGDHGDGILRRLPLGKRRHEPDCQIVAGAGTRIANSVNCIENLGVAVDALVYAPVASAEAVLDEQQKRLGALVIDMGDSTTSYAVYAGGALLHSGSFKFGSHDLRQEFACQLCLPYASGENLLIEQGCVILGRSRSGDRLTVDAGPGSLSRDIEREMLNTIIRGGVRRALISVKIDLKLSGVKLDSQLGSIHLTGGCSTIHGINELAEEVFGIRVSPARLKGFSMVASALEDPRLSCALGLVKLAVGIEA